MVGTVRTASSATTPTGSVSNMNPAGGTLVGPGSAVNLEVSSGLPQIAVPNVIGRTRGAAEGMLKSAGLLVP